MYRDLYHIMRRPGDPESCGELVISTTRNQERSPGAWRASTCNNKCVHRARYQYGHGLFPDY
jgi:hypothetical protein